MAKNTGKGYRSGSVADRTQVKNPTTGMWTKRDTKTGQFTAAKKSGSAYKGVREEK